MTIATMNLNELKHKKPPELIKIAQQMGIENSIARARTQDIIFAILKHYSKSGGVISGSGVLEILPDGFGFLRQPTISYLPGPDDIYTSPNQIRRFGLRKGDEVEGTVRPPKEGERYFAINQINKINGDEPEYSRNKILFENLTPLFPEERIKLELGYLLF